MCVCVRERSRSLILMLVSGHVSEWFLIQILQVCFGKDSCPPVSSVWFPGNALGQVGPALRYGNCLSPEVGGVPMAGNSRTGLKSLVRLPRWSGLGFTLSSRWGCELAPLLCDRAGPSTCVAHCLGTQIRGRVCPDHPCLPLERHRLCWHGGVDDRMQGSEVCGPGDLGMNAG